MENGPWHFRGDVVVLSPYDGLVKPSSVNLDFLEIWIQIHDFPEAFVALLKSLASKVGEFIFAEPKSHDFAGNFYRVKVKINVWKPLKNHVSFIK